MSRPPSVETVIIRGIVEEARDVAWWFRLDEDTIDRRIADAFDHFADMLERKWL